MDDCSSDSDFEGFTDSDMAISAAKRRKYVNDMPNESDIDVSDIDSDQIESESDENIDEEDVAVLNTEWSRDTHDIVVPKFAEKTGPTHTLPADARQLDYFFLFLPHSFFETLATETNRYAEQKQMINGIDPRWQPTSVEEMRAYIGINIMMGVRQLPRIWCYWSPDKRYGDPFISAIMPKTRFLKINQYFHLRDTSDTPGRDNPNYDPLFKVRPMLDFLSEKFLSTYLPNKELSIDEAMIGFKGRLHFRQYMPAKPTKWGIKVWELCEASTGYCSNFEVYTGKKAGVRQHGLGYDVVWELSTPFHNKNHHLYFDRFFSSVLLAEHLERVKTYTCSTIMANRKGLPEVVKKAKLKNVGDIIQVQKGRLLATVYKDKRQLSTSQSPFAGEGKPTCNLAYNQHMGGVDKSDQYFLLSSWTVRKEMVEVHCVVFDQPFSCKFIYCFYKVRKRSPTPKRI